MKRMVMDELGATLKAAPLSRFRASGFAVLALCSSICAAEYLPTAEEQIRTCLETSVLGADETMTVRDIKEACVLLINQATVITTSPDAPKTSEKAAVAEKTSDPKAGNHNETAPNGNSVSANKGVKVTGQTEAIFEPAPKSRLLKDRLTIEALNRSNRFALTPHKRNYIMAATYTDKPNNQPYRGAIDSDEIDTDTIKLKHVESELQLSVKILIRENIFHNNGHLYLGYTNHSMWQVYNRKTSAPFRESDHQPELILSFYNDFEIFGFRNVLNEGILNHQSNGQTGALSRSWNRLMLNSVFEKDNFVFAFSPWYRLPENDAEYVGDPDGDDNPEITHFMGNFQLNGAYKYGSTIFNIETRNNFDNENRGAIELGWTFPVSATMRGYVNYFDGYGHSLIDYNVKQRVVGLGIIFTDLF